jgi:hypothetical protein
MVGREGITRFTYVSEVISYVEDIPSSREDVIETIVVFVADIDGAVVEGSEHLLPCLLMSV